MARSPCAHEAGHTELRIRIEHLGIEEEIVDAPVDDIHSYQPFDRAHVYEIVASDDQVRAFDQFCSHGLCQVGVFEIRRVVYARC